MIEFFLFLLMVVGLLICWELHKFVSLIREIKLMMTPPTLKMEIEEGTPPPIKEEDFDPDSKVEHGRLLEMIEGEEGRETVEEREFKIETDELKGRERG